MFFLLVSAATTISIALAETTGPQGASHFIAEGVGLAFEGNTDSAEQALVTGKAVDRDTLSDLRVEAKGLRVERVTKLHHHTLPIAGLHSQVDGVLGADGASNGTCTCNVRL